MERLRGTLAGLRALGEDHRSGAAEIADRAAALLEEFCRGQQASDPRLPYALAALAEATLEANPAMAPLLNLANLLQLAAESQGNRLAHARRGLAQFRRQQREATERIGRLFARRVPKRSSVLTYSYSSTVLKALAAARARIAEVYVSEGRPQNEGRKLAAGLAARGVKVTLVVDALLFWLLHVADVVAVGADAVFPDAYLNKTGTWLLQEEARRLKKPFFVLAGTSKFLAPSLAPLLRHGMMPPREVWRNPPAGVTVINAYFQAVPLERPVQVLTERGAMSPAQARSWASRLPVARRWRAAKRNGRQ